jgi:hypothetical protein
LGTLCSAIRARSMKNLPGVVLLLLLVLLNHQACGRDLECVQVIARGDLMLKSTDQQPLDVDAGEGVAFRLLPGGKKQTLAGPVHSWMRITVLDRGESIKDLPDSFYTEYALLSSGHARTWMIGEYTGGMHCCVRNHFFARSTEDQPLRYLGATAGSAAGPDGEPFHCRGGAIFLKDSDVRFLYFHTAYVGSRLDIPLYYRLTASSLRIDNRPFRNEYLREIASLDREITALLAKRKSMPFSMLQAKDDSLFFSDEVGQLLVKRTLLYLVAGEDRQAWKSLDRGVAQHYRSTKGAGQVKSEIKKIMKESPY